MSILTCCLFIVLLPLIGSIIAGFFRNQIGKVGAHCATLAGVGISFFLSIYVAVQILSGSASPINVNLYTWLNGGDLFPYSFHVGFLIDTLTVVMMVIVTFVSLLVHIYSIGYMEEDSGYQRFFSYISLFTFMMLMLVTSNNFMQLFFGWEGVGLVSYLLIGFWYQKESALQGSLKAFLVNRVGDFGFILGIGMVLAYTGSLDYTTVFNSTSLLAGETIELFNGHPWSVITVMCILLYIGAMGKSAQVPLHIWLPESMEGPTPISALIHAATMVTAGVFMIARISPMIEYTPTALSLILVIGATGALFTGVLALVMNDIKRVVAYSTLSQLGYMMVAMGLSAYNAGMFHLLTHACFKALLFLAAGSVIIGMHHEQDMRKMGGLWKKMPVTYTTYLIGTLALCAIPPFSGFYSKDTIIEAVLLSQIPGTTYAYYCVSIGAIVTALYSFRSLFMTFHGTPRMSQETYEHVHESRWVVWLPLVLLAVPSIGLGYVLFVPMLFKVPGFFADSIYVLPEHNLLEQMGDEVISPYISMLHGFKSPLFWATLGSGMIMWLLYVVATSWPAKIVKRFSLIYCLLVNKYGIDQFTDTVFVNGFKLLGRVFYSVSEQKIIDGFIVNGSAKLTNWLAFKSRKIQSGYLYHYITVMFMSLIALISWLLLAS
ncbi:MAG: NADH-quinone oxidoreductase subunit L [Legionella sp.]